MVTQDPKLWEKILSRARRTSGSMALGPSQTLSKKTTSIPKATYMSYAIVGLTTDLALTLSVQINFCSVQITVGPSSPFCCGMHTSSGIKLSKTGTI